MKTYICSFETSLLNNFDNLFDANLVNIFSNNNNRDDLSNASICPYFV